MNYKDDDAFKPARRTEHATGPRRTVERAVDLAAAGGGDISVIPELAGHADIRTTTIDTSSMRPCGWGMITATAWSGSAPESRTGCVGICSHCVPSSRPSSLAAGCRTLLHGERPRGAPDRLTLLDTTKLPMSGGGWVLLGERPEEEIALGLVGKFWRPVIEYAQVDPPTFTDFAAPGFAKTVYALGTRPMENGKTLLWAIMRTATTDEPARTWFRRYWIFGVGYGAHVLVHGLLDVVREDAERRQGT